MHYEMDFLLLSVQGNSLRTGENRENWIDLLQVNKAANTNPVLCTSWQPCGTEM